MFHRWLVAAKKARHKRLQLQAQEEEFKLTVIAGAWDKWRERFLDIRLQPLVGPSVSLSLLDTHTTYQADAFIKQKECDLLCRAFVTWHRNTRSLPAVHFHASHLKTKYWKKWGPYTAERQWGTVREDYS